MSADEVAEHVAALRRFPVALVAEKVETYGQFARCQVLGFDFHQGYFFAWPKRVTGRAMVEDRLGVLQLLELTRTIPACARLCATLVLPGRGNADNAFMAGLFSGLDALMDRPLAQLLGDLPLAEETRLAVLEQRGLLGQILAPALLSLNLQVQHPDSGRLLQ